MAEQIRSFWSHLCGMFGAIFGMIAGGTLVTIEHAGAQIFEANTNVELGNGAVVSYKYGSYSERYYDYNAGYGWCLKLCEYDDTSVGCNRWYVQFLHCADGYYQNTTLAEGSNLTLRISSSTSAIGYVASPSLGTLRDFNACEELPLCNGSRPSTTTGAKGVHCEDSFISPFTGQEIPWNADEYEQTYGLCSKCPSYGEYAAYTTSGQRANISSCFMSRNTEYSDTVDQSDGVATGKFIWTSDCYYGVQSGGTTGGGTTGGGTTATTIQEQVINIIAERMNISAANITLNSTLYGDLGMDELDFMETVWDLENEFNVEIDAEVYENWTTVADIVYWMQENV